MENLLEHIDLKVSVDPFNLILIDKGRKLLLFYELQEFLVEGVVLHLLAYLSEVCQVERALSWDIHIEALLQAEDLLQGRGIHFVKHCSEVVIVVRHLQNIA